MDNKPKTYQRKIKLGKRRMSKTNNILLEYDGLDNIKRMLNKLGYTLKSKEVEKNELDHLSSVLCENVALLEQNVQLNTKIMGLNASLRYKDVVLNSTRGENNRLKRRISYLQRGFDNVIKNNNCDVSINEEYIGLKVNGSIDISLNKSYSNHEIQYCIICFEEKSSVKLPCAHFICCDCVIEAKDAKIGDSMLLDKCPYCRKPTNPNLIRIDIN